MLNSLEMLIFNGLEMLIFRHEGEMEWWVWLWCLQSAVYLEGCVMCGVCTVFGGVCTVFGHWVKQTSLSRTVCINQLNKRFNHWISNYNVVLIGRMQNSFKMYLFKLVLKKRNSPNSEFYFIFFLLKAKTMS